MAELDGESVSLRAQLRTPSASRTAAAALSAGSLFGPSSSCRDSGGSQQQLFRDRPALWDLLAAPRRRGASSYRRSRLYKVRRDALAVTLLGAGARLHCSAI